MWPTGIHKKCDWSILQRIEYIYCIGNFNCNKSDRLYGVSLLVIIYDRLTRLKGVGELNSQVKEELYIWSRYILPKWYLQYTTMKKHTSREDIEAIPSQYLEMIAHYLMGIKNESLDLSKPHLKPTVLKIYPLFIFIYAALIIAGCAMNVAMIFHIGKNKLYKDPTYAFIVNIAISDLVKSIFVLPITLVVILVQNWVFGKFLCYFLPMLQVNIIFFKLIL